MASMPSGQKCFSEDKAMIKTPRLLAAALILTLTGLSSASLRAEDAIEKAGVAVGVTAGNIWVLPIKAITVTVGVLSGALSYIATGGNTELTQQIWQDTLQEPYVVTRDLARRSIGERPELQETK
jgi:hypothetical protein